MDLKKFSFALVVVIAVLLIWHFWALQQRRKGPTTQPTTTTGPTAAQPAPSDKPEPRAPALASKPEAKAEAKAKVSTNQMKWVGLPKQKPQELTIGSLAHDGEYMFAVDLTNRGAAVNTIKLTKHFATVADKRLFDKDPAAYEKQWPTKGKKYGGHYSLLNPAAHGKKEFLPLATRVLHIKTSTADGKGISLVLNLDSKFWKLASHTDKSATFVYELARGNTADWDQAAKVLRITKTYTVAKNDHRVFVSLKVENLWGNDVKVTVDQAGPTGLPREGIRADNRSAVYAKRRPDQEKPQFFRKPIKELGTPGSPSETFPKVGRHVVVGTTHEATPTLWIGHTNQFFGSMMYLPGEPGAIWKGKFYAAAAEESADSRTFLTGIVIEGLRLAPRATKEMDFELFAGPKKRDLFTDEDHPQFKQQYKDLNYLSTINLKVCFCAFSWLSLAMMWLLQKLSAVALGNYGVAIILLVVLVRIVLHPLAKKSQVSMMKMQKLAPQIQKLKEKYKDDKETLNKEMMRFYKQQGTTPILGCLPMMLQMPIWIALWTSVQASVELRHSAFLPFWIIDLAAPDKLYSWADRLPLVGTDLNLLPILLTVAMFLQAKMNPQMGQVAATEQQQQQQKMMRYMMPAMMLFIFYAMPSGVTLYIMASTFAGVAEQYVIRRHIRMKEAAAAASETTIAVPGKPPRSARPKKPKGPNWTKHG
ncbi:MAG: YidC/Oxa1 family insertase periplasmic-domain containing protein [Phycisphaerae bacterium]|nr:YidC/Oxa1 family insertase periplasmic-domain containing protein [Phycisphaerae bacterium]